VQTPSQVDAAMIGTVNAHVSQLATLSSFDADESKIRVASSSLRYLLVEGMLARGWKTSGLGGPVTVRAWCVDSMQGDGAVAFCGGGDLLPGIPFSACFNATLAERSLDLGAFCQKARIQVGTVKISTIELVQYVSNTLGGTHFDPTGRSPKSRKPAFDLMRKLDTGALAGITMVLNGRNLIHHEVLSVAQVLIKSPEVRRLMSWRAAVN
jgi:hypothetical protein